MGEERSGQASTPPEQPRSYLRLLARLLAARKGTLVRIMSVSLVLNVAGLASPRLTQTVLDQVVPAANLSLLGQVLAVLVAVAVVQHLLTIWRRVTLVRLSLDVDRSVLGTAYAHLLALPAPFFGRYPTGDLMSRLHGHGHVRHLCVGAFPRAALDAVMVGIYAALLLAYSGQLAAIVLGLLVVFATYTLLMGPALRRQHQRLAEAQARQDTALVEALTGIVAVKAMTLEGTILERWMAGLDAYLAANRRTQALRQVLESLGTALQSLTTLAVLGYGAVLVTQGTLTLGELAEFGLYAGQVVHPLGGLILVWDEVQQARAAAERVQTVLAEPPEAAGPAEIRADPGPLTGNVEFAGVSFRYGPDSPWVLRGVTFVLKPGEHVALAGRSGAGKSTIAKLLLGLYQPTQGRVLIDGQDLARMDLEKYRRQLGVVLQEDLVLSGTVLENIALGDPQPDLGWAETVARQAGAHAFLAALPEGYATAVGAQGLTLSAGQRQRLNLARALYREPRLLVLDEPTSALDGMSEREVQVGLAEALKGRTALVIAHRLTTVRAAERVLVLHEGVIAEDGPPAELLQRGSVLAALVAGQLEL